MLIRTLALFLISGFSALAGINVDVTYRFAPAIFKGDSTLLIAHIRLPAGWHIQSDAPLDSFLVATSLVMEGEGLKFGKPAFPKATLEEMPALGGKVAVFNGELDIKAVTKKSSSKTTVEALKKVKVSLRYQACNNTQCLPPRVVEAVLEGKVRP